MYIDDELKFHQHTSAVAKKANQVLGLIKKSFKSRDKQIMSTLFKTMVIPHIEYGNGIWGPHYQSDIRKIESIQRRATKVIDHLKYKPYEDRLKALTLPSLVYRRKRGDMIQMYKIMNGIVRVNENNLN